MPFLFPRHTPISSTFSHPHPISCIAPCQRPHVSNQPEPLQHPCAPHLLYEHDRPNSLLSSLRPRLNRPNDFSRRVSRASAIHIAWAISFGVGHFGRYFNRVDASSFGKQQRPLGRTTNLVEWCSLQLGRVINNLVYPGASSITNTRTSGNASATWVLIWEYIYIVAAFSLGF